MCGTSGIIAAGIIGGTASVISGGKFANGALSGALAQMYNGEETLDIEVRWRKLVNEFKISILDAYMMGKEGDIEGYINKVKTNGDWDFKHVKEYRTLDGIEDFGNFAFGATSQAWADGFTEGYSATLENYKFSTNLAMRGAGAYQEYFQTYNENDGSWYDINDKPGATNYGDSFQDGANVWQGAMYYYRRKGIIK